MQPSEVPSSYASRPISSPPGGQSSPPQSSVPSYPRNSTSSPPYTPSSNPVPAPSSSSSAINNNNNNNNAAYRPGSSGGPQVGGVAPASVAPQQRPYQPMAGQPAPASVPQNPQPQPTQQSQPGSGGPPLLRRMDSRSSISVAGGGGGVGNGATPQQQQQPQLNRPPQPQFMQQQQQPIQPRPQQPQMMRPQQNPNTNPTGQMFRPPSGAGPAPQQQQFQKMPQQFQQPSLGQQPAQRPPPQMMMMRPQMGPNGQPMPAQMRPSFPGPGPGPRLSNPATNLRPTMQTPGQFATQPRMDTSDLMMMRPSSRNSGGGGQHLSVNYDDDDDVVIGRSTTPNYQTRPNAGLGGNGNREGQQQPVRPPSQQSNQLPFNNSGDPSNQQFRSIPSRPPSRPQSRPPSGPDNSSSPSPDGMSKQGGGGGVSFLDSPLDGNKSGLNLRSIPELGARPAGNPMLPGQQFRVGQMVGNKQMAPNPNFQSSSVNLNSILNVDRSRPMSRELPSNEMGSATKRESDKLELSLAALSKRIFVFAENQLKLPQECFILLMYKLLMTLPFVPEGDNDSGVDESTQGTVSSKLKE